MTSPAVPAPSAIEQIYQQLMSVLGGTNPNQFFTMTIPGTMLNQSDFAYDTTRAKPAIVAEAESRLVDQMFDLAKVTGSSNGERVSTQYLQALSVLIPKFEPMMPTMKKRLRAFLASPAPADATVDGKPFTGTLEELYFALYESWLAKKAAWDQQVIQARRENEGSPEAFLEWYEGVAEAQLALIDAAEGRLVSVFSPSDMNAILGALAAGPSGDLQEASNQVLDSRLPSPSGGYIYPVDLSPSNWFLELASDQDPVNLLDDPQFIALTLTGRRQALQATIGQVQALIGMIPAGALAAAGAALASAQTEYTQAQSDLVNRYATNTVTAVEMLLAKTSASAALARTVDGLDQDVAVISRAKGEKPPATNATKSDGSLLTDEDFAKLQDGHTALVAAQSALTTKAQALATAGMNLASDESHTFGDLPPLLSRLQSQLTDITTLQGQLATAAANPRPTPPSARAVSPAVMSIAASVIADANAGQTSATTWLTALYDKVKDQVGAQPLYTASAAGWVGFIANAVTDGVNRVDQTAANVLNAASIAATVQNSTGDSIKTAVRAAIQGVTSDAVNPVIATINSALPTAADATPQSVLDAVKNQVKVLRDQGQAAVTAAGAATDPAQTAPYPTAAPSFTEDPVTTAVKAKGITPAELAAYLTDSAKGIATTAAKSAEAVSAAVSAAKNLATGYQLTGAPAASASPSSSADRWMDLQFSFDSSQMSSSSSSSTFARQTSWSVDLFFGSASGSSSSSSASFAKDSLSEDTRIEIGMKATKVDIARGWFDPGLFKLTSDMHRLTAVPVSLGRIDLNSSTNTQAANDAILPCFPVSFVVVKDVTIQFQAQHSQMSAVQSVLDSRGAVGGGFLCFSASSSSASHSGSSSLHTKTDQTTVTINMPGAQILGWFCEFTPADGSSILTYPTPPGVADKELDIVGFVEALSQLSRDGAPPAKPEPVGAGLSGNGNGNGATSGNGRTLSPVAFRR